MDSSDSFKRSEFSKYPVISSTQGPPDPPPLAPVCISVVLPKGTVMIPSWLALIFVGLFTLASFGLLILWESTEMEIREIRSLQLYEQDIENVLIRSQLATREDFAPRVIKKGS